jgi:hypothetical protein
MNSESLEFLQHYIDLAVNGQVDTACADHSHFLPAGIFQAYSSEATTLDILVP